MARTEIPVTTITRSGVAPPALTDGDAATDMYIANNDARIEVEIVSSDAGAQTVEFEIPTEVDGQAVAPKVVAVPAGATRKCGPWPRGIYNQEDGSLYINPSVSTTLKFRAYKLPAQ